MDTLWIRKSMETTEELDENGNRTGVVVEGEMYYLSDLAQDPFASELKNRILNTNDLLYLLLEEEIYSNNKLSNKHRYANEDS